MIINVIRGFFMALADSVPGVSGGTIAFLMGFFDKFINSLNYLLKGTKEEKIKSIKFLVKLFLGWIIGMGLAVTILANLFDKEIYKMSSLFLGFIIAVITLLEFKGPALTSLFVPIMILGIPILDTLFAIIRRLLKHQPPFAPDKDHIHHQLLGMNFSHRTTVLIIYGIDFLFATASIFYILKDPVLGKVFYILIFIVVVWFVLRTSIISPKNKEVTDSIIDKVEGTIKKEKRKKSKKVK